MKLLLKDVFVAQNVIAELSKMKLKFNVLHKLDKLITEMSKELSFIETNRITLVEKYKDETGNVAKDNMELFNKDFVELLNVEVELNVMPLSVDELKDVELNYDEYTILKKFIQ